MATEDLVEIKFLICDNSNVETSDYIYCFCSRVFCRNTIMEALTENYDNQSKLISDINIEYPKCCDLSQVNISNSYEENGSGKFDLDINLQASTDSHHIKNCNYLKDDAWNNYWGAYGHSLVWKSWIEKYSEYINPEFSEKLDIMNSANHNEELPYQISSDKQDLLPSSSDAVNSITLKDYSYDIPYNIECIVNSSESTNTLVQSSDNIPNSDHGWQLVWEKHFNEIYSKHYALFLADHMIENYDTSLNCLNMKTKSVKDKTRKKRKNTKYITSVGALLKNLNSVKVNDCENNFTKNGSSLCGNYEKYYNLDLDNSGQDQFKQQAVAASVEINEGSSANCLKDNSFTNLKTKKNSDRCTLEKGKAAFALLGLACSGNQNQLIQAEEVIYKKKKIRLLNKHLRFPHYQYNNRIHFSLSDINTYSNLGENIEKKNITSGTSLSDDGKPFHAAKSIGELQIEECKSKNLLTETKSREHLELLQYTNHGGTDDSQSFENDSSLYNKCYFLNYQDTNERIITGKKSGKRIKKLFSTEFDCEYNLTKYWCSRYTLFSKYDQGILMDAESWYSVSPEKVAEHTAERCRCDLIIDGFCGAGGNAIQFAKICERVIAIDIDPEKIRIARHNAAIYGVADRIEFIVGDFLLLSEYLIGDVVFLSPPWGGPLYLKSKYFDVERNLQPVSGTRLITAARNITHNIAIFLPRNTDASQLVVMAGPGSSVEIEQNFLEKKLIALTAYYGDLIIG